MGALTEAITRHCKPAIMNTGQGSQFMRAAFTEALKHADIQMRMDGKDSARQRVHRTSVEERV